MIKFFRQIRKMLIENNRFGKYSLYALGEIFLVVVGILIAFNVNNWNEQRKLRDTEIKYFKTLKVDLEADLSFINEMMVLSEKKVKAARRQKNNTDRMEISSPYEFGNDMTDLIFVNEFRPNDNTFEEMKSSGFLSLIQNDSLKIKLQNLTKSYQVIAGSHEHMRYDFNIFLEDFVHYIDWGKYYVLAKSDIPNLDLKFDSTYIESHTETMKSEIRTLYQNKVFLNHIYLFEVNYTWIIKIFEDTKIQINEILVILEEEIEEN